MTKLLENNKSEKGLFKYPWGYPESIIITVSLFITGIALEIMSKGNGLTPLQWPYNVLALLIYISIIIVFYNTNGKSGFIRYITGLPITLSFIVFMGLLILLMGFIQQNDRSNNDLIKLIGFSHIKISYTFFLAQMMLLSSLGFTIMKRFSKEFSIKNIAFIVNHTGLWITLAAAYAGSGDVQKINMYLYKGKDFTNQAYIGTHNKTPQTLPFELKLHNFHILNHPPEFGIHNLKKDKYTISDEPLSKGSNYKKIKHNSWQIKPVYFMRSASQIKNDFVESDYSGSAPAMYVMARDTANFISKAGWITCGSHTINKKAIQLDSNTIIFMTKPKPKEFSSKVLLKNEVNNIDTINIQINKPLKYGKWKVYQAGYNEKMGIWSDLSVLEAIKDPWLPGIYIGIILLLISSFYLIWRGYRE